MIKNVKTSTNVTHQYFLENSKDAIRKEQLPHLDS